MQLSSAEHVIHTQAALGATLRHACAIAASSNGPETAVIDMPKQRRGMQDNISDK